VLRKNSPPWRSRRSAYAALAALVLLLVGSVGSAATADDAAGARPEYGQSLPGFTHGTVTTEGVTLHYVRGGSGPPLVLLHGWPQTWWAWAEVMPTLAQTHTVIAFDLPGLGESGIPTTGYDKVSAASRIRGGVRALGFDQVSILGHDVGALIAYPYARDYPTEVGRLAVLETPLSGFGLENVYGARWHFGFNQTAAPVPETLIDNDDVSTYLSWMFSSARHPERVDQEAFFRAYASPTRRSAGYDYYRAMPTDIANNQANASRRLPMPVLAMGAQYAFGPLVANSFRQVADDVRAVTAPDTGHWLTEENPTFVAACAALFFGPPGVPAPTPELAPCAA